MVSVNVYKIPRHLPPFKVLWEDIGKPHPATLADCLGVDVRTVRRWMKAQHAPRPVCLALFWLTRWGQSELDADMAGRAQNMAAMVDCLTRELSALRNRLTQMETAQAPAQAAALGVTPRTPWRLAPRSPLIHRPAPAITCGA